MEGKRWIGRALFSGIIFCGQVFFASQAESAFLTQGNGWTWRWKQTETETMGVNFDAAGGLALSLNGECIASTEFEFYDGARRWHYNDLMKEGGPWDKVTSSVGYAPTEPQRFGDVIKQLDISGVMDGVEIGLRYLIDKSSIEILLKVKATKPGIRDFMYQCHQNNGELGEYLVLQSEGRRIEMLNKKGFPEIHHVEQASKIIPEKWLIDYRFEGAGEVILREHGHPAVGSLLAIYPEKPGEDLKVGKTYETKIKIEVKPTSLTQSGTVIRALDGRAEPVFRCGEENALAITLPENSKIEEARLKDALEKRDLGPVFLKEAGRQRDGARRYEWRYKTSEPGVMELEVKIVNQKGQRRTLTYQVANIGKIKQETSEPEKVEDHLKLQLVDQIDCGNEKDPHPFKDGPSPSRILDTPLGKYREAGETGGKSGYPHSWMLWELKVKNPYRTHVVEIEYPDDKNRTIGIGINDGIINPRCGTGAVCGGYYPNSNQIQKLRLFYYPQREEAVVAVGTAYPDSPAAVKSIRLYEVTGDIPAIEIKNPVQDRFFGFLCEGFAPLVNSFAAMDKPEYLANANFIPRNEIYAYWYRAIANYIRFMRLTGQNFYSAGILQYDRNYYSPSEELLGRVNYSFASRPGDFYALMARMFEANDMNLILTVEFGGTSRLFCRAQRYGEQEMRDGARTIRQVSRDGRFVDTWMGPLLNYQALEVEGAMAKVAKEIASHYGNGKFPAVKGVGFVSGRVWGPSYYRPYDNDDPFAFSYDDITIGQFEQETGVVVPVDKKDPQRFAKRYDWIMKNAREKWVTWRCNRIKSAHTKIAKAINSNKLDYYLLTTRDPMDVLLQYHWEENGQDIGRLQKDEGLDYDLYKRVKGMVLGRDYYTNDVRRQGPAWTGKPDDGASREYNWSQKVRDTSDNGPANTLHHIWNQFYELQPISGGFGGVPTPRGADYLWPGGGRLMGDDLVTAIGVGEVPGTILAGFVDSHFPTGFWEDLSKFTKVYRTLPLGEYKTLTGKGLDKNIVVREAVIEKYKYFFAVNPCFWEVTVTLGLEGGNGQKLLDLVADREKVLSGNSSFNINLGPYEAFSCRIPREVVITDAKTQVSREGIDEISRRIAELETFTNQADVSFPDSDYVKSIRKELLAAKEAFLQNDCKQALFTVEGFTVRHARRILTEEKAKKAGH